MTGEHAAFLFRSAVPNTLRRIHLQIITAILEEVHTVLGLIAQSTPRLSTLKIECAATLSIHLHNLTNTTKYWSRLTNLIIIVDVPLDLDDESVKTLATALPVITHLELGPNITITPSHTNVTLNSLEVVAASCPTLLLLAIYVNTDQSNPRASTQSSIYLFPLFGNP